MQKILNDKGTGMKPGKSDFDVKAFVRSLCALKVSSSSKQIAEFLMRKGHKVSPGTIASIKAHFTRKQNKI